MSLTVAEASIHLGRKFEIDHIWNHWQAIQRLAVIPPTSTNVVHHFLPI